MPFRRVAFACACAVLLAGCSLFGARSTGQPSEGLKTPSLAAAYIPLDAHEMVLIEHWGAGIVVAPQVAVTNAHNFNLVAPDAVLAVSKDYDLLFFRTEKSDTAPLAPPRPGAAVIAYGQGARSELREALGTIRAVDVRVAPRCARCAEQRAIAYDADAGPGFSGGPLVDAQTGAVVGLTFGYRDQSGPEAGRRMFAYSMATVLEEMHRLLGPEPGKL
ncbi:MAG: S1 family peptidase [Alphaproteobacteria bacterium]